MFLRHIANEISRPIERADGAHVGYVPTQVVAEYIRDRLTLEGIHVEGIKYASATNEGHASYVLFADQGDIKSSSEEPEDNGPWLQLVGVDHHRVVLTPQTELDPGNWAGS